MESRIENMYVGYTRIFCYKDLFFMALHCLQILDKDHQWQQVAEAFKQRENISKEADKSVKEAR